jgi:hypothetical protein
MSRKILNGWKEISNHIERGVRTAQRWEALLGMPVHRPALKDRSAVVAFADELDRWIARTEPAEDKDMLARVLENVSSLSWHTAELATQTRSLEKQIKRSLKISRRRRSSTSTRPAPSAAHGRNAAMLPFRPKSGATIG